MNIPSGYLAAVFDQGDGIRIPPLIEVKTSPDIELAETQLAGSSTRGDIADEILNTIMDKAPLNGVLVRALQKAIGDPPSFTLTLDREGHVALSKGVYDLVPEDERLAAAKAMSIEFVLGVREATQAAQAALLAGAAE